MSVTRINVSCHAFVQPDIGNTVGVKIDSGIGWIVIGMFVQVEGAGIYQVVSYVNFTLTIKLLKSFVDAGINVPVSVLFPISEPQEIPDDTTLVHTTGDETIDGIKTFLKATIIPDATQANQATAFGQLTPINTAISALQTSSGSVLKQPTPINPSAGAAWPAASKGDTFYMSDNGWISYIKPYPLNSNIKLYVKKGDLLICTATTPGGVYDLGNSFAFISTRESLETIGQDFMYSVVNSDLSLYLKPSNAYLPKIGVTGYNYNNSIASAGFLNIDPRIYEGMFMSYMNKYGAWTFLFSDFNGNIFTRGGIGANLNKTLIFLNESNQEQYTRPKSKIVNNTSYTVLDQINCIYCTGACTITLPNPATYADRELRIIAANGNVTIAGFTYTRFNQSTSTSVDAGTSVTIKALNNIWISIQEQSNNLTTESDPIYTSSPASSITPTDITDWDSSGDWGAKQW